jgi:NAD(P)-dependent dehydrogenase (short-subunit alcohol dehydrogenase family)
MIVCLTVSISMSIAFASSGVMACPEGQTEDGFETQFGTNHLGHFLLFELLKPALLASSTPQFQSRVVALSSSGHRTSAVHLDDLDLKRSGYDPWKAYGQSKTANIHMATEIERRYGSKGLHAFALNPGGIRTALQRHMPQQMIDSMSTPQFKMLMKSPEQGAATTVWAAVSKELEGKGGKYLENCSIAGPRPEGEPKPSDPGYAPHAYDEDNARELWTVSLKMIGISAD